MEEIKDEQGFFYFPEQSTEAGEERVAVGNFSFSPTEGVNISIYAHQESYNELEQFFQQEKVTGVVQEGHLSVFGIYFCNINQKTYFPTVNPKKWLPKPSSYHGRYKLALRHPPDFPYKTLSDIRFESIEFSLDHLTEWIDITTFAKNSDEGSRDIIESDEDIKPREKKIITDKSEIIFKLYHESKKNRTSSFSSCRTSIQINFLNENGLDYIESVEWVCLFQSLLSLAAKSPANINFFHGSTLDGHTVVIYPMFNFDYGGLKDLKYRKDWSCKPDGEILNKSMDYTLDHFGTEGVKTFINEIIDDSGYFDITLLHLATLGNRYFTRYPNGFDHVELVQCCESIYTGENPNSKFRRITKKSINLICESVKPIILEITSEENYDNWRQQLRHYRNNVVHGSSKEEINIREDLLSDSLELAILYYTCSPYIDVTIWKPLFEKFF